MDKNLKKVDKFVISSIILYQSSLGYVYKGFLSSDPTLFVASKIIDINLLQTSISSLQMLRRETELLKKIDHINIQKLYSVAKTKSNFYLFLEYCEDGTLEDYLISKNGFLSKTESIHFFQQLLSAFQELNLYNIIHCNLKPDCIFLQEGILKVGEFSFSKFWSEFGIESVSRFSIRNSESIYMSPQILENTEYSSKCDIWSLGVIFYKMLYGVLPWKGNSPAQIISNIKSNKLIFSENEDSKADLHPILRRMLSFTENNRISWIEILNQDFDLNQNSAFPDLEEGSGMLASSVGIVHYMIQTKVMDSSKRNRIKDFLKKESTITTSRKMKRISKEGLEFNNLKRFIEFHEKQILECKVSKEIDEVIMKERNMAIFFSNVAICVSDLLISCRMNFFDKTYQFQLLIIVLHKYALIQLIAVIDEMKLRTKSRFDYEKWEIYLNSSEYTNSLSLISDELEVLYEEYHEFKFKFKSQTEKIILEGKENINDFVSREDYKMFMENMDTFHERPEQYEILKYCISWVKDHLNENPDLNFSQKKSLLNYFRILEGDYKFQFSEKNFDFHKFYEKIER